jgi:nucleotide-binding universal stress UspA family protein
MLKSANLITPLLTRLRSGRATVGLELAKPDDAMLAYLRFLFGKVPVAELRFVHVVPGVDFFATETVTTLEMDEHILAAMQVEITDAFRELKGVNATLEVRSGRPIDELVEELEAPETALVVIGQRDDGRPNVLARKLARRTDCPVLVIPEDARPTMDHILVPIDFSTHSAEALRTAIALREMVNPEARISAVHIYELPDLSPYRASRTPEEMEAAVRSDREAAMNRFLNDHLGDDAQQVEPILINHNMPGITRYLLDFAEDQDVDFVVMGAKGHSKLELLLLGSVAENFLSDNEEFPVLLVKE